MIYTVQAGDTPMGITQKLLGNPTHVNELVRANAHKQFVSVTGAVTGLGSSPTLTFRDLYGGEQLNIPANWRISGVGDCSPSYAVRPNAHSVNEFGDEQEPEPIKTVSGPSKKKPCCARCGQTGGSCNDGKSNTIKNPCSISQAPQSIPGSTSFPVGFGRGVGQGPLVTQSPVVAVAASWGVPLAVGVLSAAAGFG